MKKNKVLEDYIKYKKTRVNSINKINDIEFQIKNFIYFKRKELKDLNESDLVEYITKISNKYAPWTLIILKSYIKNFIKWYYVDWSARFRNLDNICRSNKPPSSFTANDMLTFEDVEKIIKTENSPFWKAYFLSLFYGGNRATEVCLLKWKDIEFEEDGGAYFTIFSRKNNKEFTKYIPPKQAFYLKQLQNNNSEFVFSKSNGTPIGRKGALWRFKKVSKKALGKDLKLQTLRHSIATTLYSNEKLKDDDVANQMGHSKSMKNVYVHKNKQKLKEIAKNIYIETENLPPEKKLEFEKRIEFLEKELQEQPEKTMKLFLERLEQIKKSKLVIK